MYLANTAILNFDFPAEDITSDYEFLLWLVNTFSTYWHRRVLPNVLQQSKYNAKTFKNLAYFFTLCSGKSYVLYIADWFV